MNIFKIQGAWLLAHLFRLRNCLITGCVVRYYDSLAKDNLLNQGRRKKGQKAFPLSDFENLFLLLLPFQ